MRLHAFSGDSVDFGHLNGRSKLRIALASSSEGVAILAVLGGKKGSRRSLNDSPFFHLDMLDLVLISCLSMIETRKPFRANISCAFVDSL